MSDRTLGIRDELHDLAERGLATAAGARNRETVVREASTDGGSIRTSRDTVR